MSRRLQIGGVAGTLCILCALPATSEEIADTMNAFAEQCDAFLTNYQDFVGRLPIPGPLGEAVVTTTSDGSTATISTVVGGKPFWALVFVAGDRLDLSCYYSVQFQTRNFSLEQRDLQFRRWLATRPGVTMVGGFTEYDQVTAGPELSVSKTPPQYNYNIVNFFDGKDTIVSVGIGEGSFNVTAGQVFRQ